MITEKTLAEFAAMPETRGIVYLANDSPIVQIHFFTDHTDSGNKPEERYSILWKAKGLTVFKLREWSKKLVLMRSWQQEEPEYPVKVDAYYSYHSAKSIKYEIKNLYWFLFEKNLDEYDQLIQEVHEKFLSELESQIAFVFYTFDFLSTIIVQGDIHVTPSSAQEILFNFKMPVFPVDFIKTVFEETTVVQVDPNDIEEMMTRIQTELIELSRS
ncbi:MAG: hypothetical protein HY001_00580 [Candidatus Portnoybacteria bacterium]|nr:hypothetical protein [Candidatus Portnoybacteria bacterium]